MSTNPRARVAAVLGAAAAGAVPVTLLFWPGAWSFDTHDQYGQALSGHFDDVHPPLMAVLWRGLDAIVPGSGLLFAAVIAGLWLGVAATLQGRVHPRAFALLVFAVAAFPPVLLISVHVWKDVAMAAAFAGATAVVAAHLRTPARPTAIALAILLAVAVLLRHNAWPAVLPFLAVYARGLRPLPRLGARAAVALLLLALPPALVTVVSAERRHPFMAVVVWDLAAISIAVDRNLLPAEIIAPDLDVPTLRQWFRPWANPPLYDSNKIQLPFFVDWDAAKRARVRAAWLGAIREHPAAYLRHRARLSRALFVGLPADAPRELVFAARAPPGEGIAVAAQRALFHWAEARIHTPWFSAWPYALLLVFAVGVARRGPARELVWLLGASAVLYAGPLAVVSGSAEFRYLLWPVLAALLAAALSFFAPRGAALSALPSGQGVASHGRASRPR